MHSLNMQQLVTFALLVGNAFIWVNIFERLAQ